MNIYIDESGHFIASGVGPAKAAVVGALVIPSHQRSTLLREYKKLRKELRPGLQELKGSTITEGEAAKLIRLCINHDLLLVAVVVDLAGITTTSLRDFQHGQADKLVEHLSREHFPQLVHEVVSLSEDLRGLPPQLFLQAFATLQLVPQVLQFATLYYVQRYPPELGTFEWIVDAKDREITVAESTWSTILLPMMQTRSSKTPLVMLDTADYSSFEDFTMPIPDPEGRPSVETGTDLRKVIGENLHFADSRDHLGLQLTDNLVSLVGRALNNRIEANAILDLGKLMPLYEGQSIRIIKPDLNISAPETHYVSDPHWVKVVLGWSKNAKSILL